MSLFASISTFDASIRDTAPAPTPERTNRQEVYSRARRLFVEALPGREREASALDRRIVELLLEAWGREPEWDEETHAVFAAARAAGGATGLDAAFAAALAKWERDQR